MKYKNIILSQSYRLPPPVDSLILVKRLLDGIIVKYLKMHNNTDPLGAICKGYAIYCVNQKTFEIYCTEPKTLYRLCVALRYTHSACSELPSSTQQNDQ
jgi:hypothetical protein